ncbi:hypothetical protein Y887_08455 [Xanthomonas pisi DSM 18956]|uniref:Uncharacterized protein n=1 Tax=Xanthomonas pisi TaxID=56457 RepID=A0A2S7D5Q1_9XANT|nr:hypothetical protein Y887_08455 [Xanthomonas pisi DSM 18956]PPU69161.1 hypothetical protein XpiCFBP4643_06435 [Xanthomonas pisi]
MLEVIEIERLLRFRARGLDELEELVGDISTLIDARRQRDRRIRVLDPGFDFGATLMALGRRHRHESISMESTGRRTMTTGMS